MQISAEVHRRFKQSYGAWMNIAAMLTEFEALSLQSSSLYMYKVGVPRIISKFTLRGENYYITDYKVID